VNVIPLSVPDSPTAVSVSLATNTSALFTFTAPASNGGVAIDSYTVTSTPDSVTAYVLGSSSGSATLSGLRPGVTYAFGVQAGNSRGLSTVSNSLTLKIPKSPVLGAWPDISKNKADSAFSLIPPSESYTATGTFTYSSSNTGVISISGDLATIVQAGSAVITTTFNPSDTATYLSGVTKTLTITVTAATNTITFAAIENRATTASPFNLTATSTGGTVSFSSVSPNSICAVSSAGRVDLYSAGSCSITASSTGNLNYGAAPDVTQVFTVIAPSSVSKPIVLGPPPSTFVVISNPKISRSGTSLVCSSGTYKFKKQGGKEESSSITSQLISLLSKGAVVDSEKTLSAQASFDTKSSYKGTTMSCEVGIQQEEVVKTYSSIDKEGISAFEAAMTSAIYGSNTTYYSERDMAYMKRDAGDTKLWKELLEKAVTKREETKVQAGLDYIANLEKAGISILVARDKAAPVPTPTPTPAPTKSPEVSVTGNVQPVAMKLVGNIYFASGTYFLNDEAKKTIKALASSIFMKSPATVLSYGFTDSKGGTDNTLLSQNRAKAVAKLLRSLLPGQKISTGWYASSKPVATGNSKAALAKNRRVEIYIK
jgi:outer membrane protein OmpA-like peptidoglycan-associated protein